MPYGRNYGRRRSYGGYGKKKVFNRATAAAFAAGARKAERRGNRR